jgi:hypothetical protein
MLKIELKKLLALLACIFFSLQIFGQDNNNTLQRDATNLELKFDEAGALLKYKQLAANDPSNIKALVKCAELNCNIGSREKDKNSKTNYFQQAAIFAQQAYAKDSTNADVCYVVALVASKFAELNNDDNKKLALSGNKEISANIKDIKVYTDKALAANANHAKANHLAGIWHFELIRSGWLKKSGVKNFYNAIPDTQVDSAAYFMEKAKSIEPYYALNYLDLAKVYAYDHQPAKAIDVLNKLIKLPNRTYDDAAIKEEGRQLLAKMQ